jgi:class 3 adenylate cyclase
MLFATVTVAELSNFLAKSRAGHDINAFILYGREYVVAHPALARNPPQLGYDRPLPALGDLGDPVLAAFWSPDRKPGAAALLTGGSSGHVVAVGGVPYVFVYRELAGYSDRPWLIGRYFLLEELEIEVRRLARAAWIGLAIFLVVVAGAWFAGRSIARPIQRLAQATAAIRNLDLAEARPLDPSRFREIDQATTAYNSLLSALRWFETYVPRSLVLRLMAQGDEAAALEQRAVTVLFTDIAGFTPLAESLSPQAIAEFLNHHFKLIADCVEAEGGTIDKFIGDAVMAFWGAPERQSDHAIRACRAARAIADSIIAENRHRRNRGAVPVKVRIGIHTGPVIVGNIGAPGRMNYTVIGDTVNIAERLQELGREHMSSDDEVIALASEDTLAGLDIVSSAEKVGRHTLRGRREAIEVYRIA